MFCAFVLRTPGSDFALSTLLGTPEVMPAVCDGAHHAPPVAGGDARRARAAPRGPRWRRGSRGGPVRGDGAHHAPAVAGGDARRPIGKCTVRLKETETV